MRRRPKKRSAELKEMQLAFRLEVVFGGDPEALALPCWYGEHIDDPANCEGRINASHFIKKQRVDNALFAMGYDLVARQRAMWDPRLGVPGCVTHDDRWDSHQVDATRPFVIYRHQVPERVEEWADQWGLEEQVAHRCPLFVPGVSVERDTTAYANDEDRLAREAAASERALFDG